MLTKQQRELIIKLKQDGKTQQRIADLLGCSQAAVSKWIFRHKSGRTFETLPRSGRPTKLQQPMLKKLQKKLSIKVKQANKQYCSLNTKELAEVIEEETGKKYSLRHVGRIMHKLGFSLIKPRPGHIRQDPDKIRAFREEFKKNSSRSIWVMSS